MVNWKQKLNPIWWFGNIDDPNPCIYDWYLKEHCKPIQTFFSKYLKINLKKCNLLCKLKWFLWRNPLHNFTFYVIGFKDKIEEGKIKYIGKQWAGYKEWNVAYIKTKSGIKIPIFISYNGYFQFYIGWRPSGNLGAVFRKNHDFDKK